MLCFSKKHTFNCDCGYFLQRGNSEFKDHKSYSILGPGGGGRKQKIKMQLDVEVSPPANDLYMGKLHISKVIKVVRIDSFLRWSDKLFSNLDFGEVTDGQTDRQTESDVCEPTTASEEGPENFKNSWNFFFIFRNFRKIFFFKHDPPQMP